MATITLTEAKQQCRVTHNLEDDLITHYINSADDQIKNYLNREDIPVRYQIKSAALLIVMDLYNRGETDNSKAIESLLYPYRIDIGI